MRRLFILLAALLPLATALPASAQQSTPGTPPAVVDQALVERIIAYLNSVRTLEARFVQQNSDGGQATGKMWVSRPGRIRFEYDMPFGDVIWSDNNLVKHFDRDLESVTHVPAHLTPAWFLLDDQVSIKKDVEILATAELEDKAYLTASQEGALAEGRVTLAFDREPMRILGWNVVDGGGTVTQVNLISPIVGAPIDKKVFRYEPPGGIDNR
jgi:outer membrane lipoprotein-sorting protein